MGKTKVLINSLSLLINRLAQGVTTFVLTAAIARNLGAYALGQYLLAISYYYIFVNLASQGLKTLFTRELSRSPEETPVYLVSGTLLQLILSFIGYLGLVVWVFLLPYSADTSIVCYVMGLAILPFALSNITEAIFQAQEKMHLITISTVPIYILRLLVMLWVMQMRYGVVHIAGILVISELLITIIQWILLTRMIQPQWQIKRDFIFNTIKAARTFFALEGVGIIAGKLDVLILSLLGNEFLIGLYGAVTQLMQPFYIVANSANMAAFPRMSKAVYLGKEEQRESTENIIELLLCMGLPFALGLWFFGKDLLLFVYKDQSFLQADTILHLISLGIIAGTFSKALSYLLIANGLEKFNLLEVALTSTVGGLAGIVFISQYKLLGAALMGLVMSLVNFSLYMYVTYRRLFSLRLWNVLRRPLLITFLMLIVFVLLEKLNLDFLVILIASICAYGLLMGAMTVQQLGGIHKIRQKIFKEG
ncbi:MULTISPECIES: oligosaccharide flippase family protein [unclassified Tolypothrix]|uniref:oligosaccharide flippase family protein n=1 Tax=unclassified Tolypothrix TaxID=2649714 RepID=UPI0005EAC399|nr:MULTISPECIES: oligosaccharide flippase family protein [unclassified Tolypothrix]BAY93909.1 polysaccharide biosynthesis protein [Microchaete diplosiphon NIES-3275]EKF03592.1 polysaccharide biosynthesis protein [Tolypothrix sp. PCC 7601]MBE9084118.1 oligosaccharide flippase family protein [Tolypothrix sp. LEGE 11397]UYD27689.1 oligosaccharide flippase family protein [Tolypothrix sp. PCC 7712]UYD36449.1 oligosaccharide flippase family protein [Tolypothrix sp. PCC 7601]